MTLFRTTASILTLGLSLAACDMAPKYVRPELSVPAASPAGSAYAAGAADAGAIVPADTAWRDFFTDARLARVIETSLANNRDLRVALANVEQARAQYKVQRADLLPGVSARGGATYQDQPFAQQGGGAGASGRTDIYQAQVGISAWEIDLFGRVRNLTKAAQEQYFASVETRNAAQTALIAEVANAWLTMAADQDRLRISRDLEQAFGKTLALTEARFAKGIASELEVRQAQTSYDSARSDIAEATTLVAQDQNALNLLAGTTVEATDLPDAMPERGATIENLPANIASEVLLRRPDIASAEHQLRGANANIGAARAAFFPNISLTAAFGTLSMGLSNLFGSGSDFWSVAPSASLPIFDFGKNAGNLRYARATYDAMLATYEKSVQTGFREVADALARRCTMTQQIEAQTSLAESSRVAYRLSEARFRAGIDPFLTTLDSQRSLYTAERSLLATRLVRATNMVELYRAMGGGLK